jgi:lycopene cyclase domain-containing protein
MSEYLLINILIVIVPLILSFEKKIRFIKKFKSYLVSIAVISTAYIIWDSVAVYRNDWGFNTAYLSGINILNLPLEEILFFITVPYSCIFIYETVNVYIKESKVRFSKYAYLLGSFLLIVAAIIFLSQYYTFTVLLFTAAFLIIASVFFPAILKSSTYWLTILITYVPFFAVNYILTSLPIVTYNSSAIWDKRFLTIPLEDFFYSFSMISFWLLVYLISEKKLSFKKP